MISLQGLGWVKEMPSSDEQRRLNVRQRREIDAACGISGEKSRGLPAKKSGAALLDTLGWFEKTLSDTIGLQCRIRRRHAFTSSRSPCAAAFRWIQNERAGFNPKLVRAGFEIFQASRTREFFKVSSPPQFQERPAVTGSCPHAN